ncbi:hypothetical protein RN001_002638 [Aquatica leii]|uniref:DUF4806 domain-containing protein n=1 Tax=Aquatica leii TaxID=1421715 RepID=A0AAN7SKA0_9COLE|nr:hypothetical protein RN001_002638 [Aquatica leii]
MDCHKQFKQMEQQSWSVIKFPHENDAVAAVPTSWLRGNQCYWPPWIASRINIAIKNCKPPDVETWQIHPFTPLRNNVFDDFESAKKKAKKATETSDLESLVESQSELTDNQSHRKKRKTMKTTFTRFASFEVSEDDTSCETYAMLPEPPKCKSEFYTLADLAEDINEIKNKLDHNNSNSVEDGKSIFGVVNLPIDSVTDLQKLEEYLDTDRSMSSAIKEIATSGGKNVYDLVYRATQKLVTNKFAAGYSYFGRGKKLKFSSLKLNGLLIKAALKIFPNCSEKEAEVTIAKWLRRCAERAKKE